MKLSKETTNKLLSNSINIKQNKYKNKKVEYDGIVFDSIKEKSWYIKYKLMEKSEEIWDLQRQVKFPLIETFKLNGRTYRTTYYIADFVFTDKDNKVHVVDVKGVKTQVYQLKKKLMAWKYGIEIEEV